MGKTSPLTVAGYLDELQEPRKSEVAAVHGMIVKALPKLKPAVASGMIGYGSYHYKYESGREGDAPVVALSSRKEYISVYVYGAEEHQAELPQAAIGKSCIRFKRLADIDLKILEKIVKLGADARTSR